LPTVDVSALSSGMYHVQFTSQAGRATSKLHIQ
jgi:hypothetical protein